MIPYFLVPEIPIYGPFSIKPFGTLVVGGIVAGYFLARKRAREKGIKDEDLQSMIRWTVGVGLVMAHVLEVILYHPQRLSTDGILTLFKFWEGLSSFGGLFGAFVASQLYAHRMKRPWRVYADFMIQGWVLGWVFGRLGCTLVHDHPGQLTDFALAFAYPGGARHNLGFYELVYTLVVMLPGILWFHKRRPNAPAGTYVVLVTLMYTPLRFVLDFLRATDVPGADLRYAGLTPAQWGCIGFFAAAAVLWTKLSSASPRRAASAR
ncbi:MAG: prolipoprotein diacylglyceryl transferase [Bdellovibrionales bacterium]|nr:prolipoprotein diacylglyceryl transferase [Bdellovibrionales bacterium]